MRQIISFLLVLAWMSSIKINAQNNIIYGCPMPPDATTCMRHWGWNSLPAKLIEYAPPIVVPIMGPIFAIVLPKGLGLIQYTVIDPTDAVGMVALIAIAGSAGASLPQNVGVVAANAAQAAAAEVTQEEALDEFEDAA